MLRNRIKANCRHDFSRPQHEPARAPTPPIGMGALLTRSCMGDMLPLIHLPSDLSYRSSALFPISDSCGERETLKSGVFLLLSSHPKLPLPCFSRGVTWLAIEVSGPLPRGKKRLNPRWKIRCQDFTIASVQCSSTFGLQFLARVSSGQRCRNAGLAAIQAEAAC